MATAMGRALARRIQEPDAPFDMPIVRIPSIPLHSLWPLAVRGAIAKGRILDLLGR
jgi:hypothetical protein